MTSKSHEEMESRMKELFRPMDCAVAKIGWTFGQGPGMHADAREAAPEWLRKWDDNHRWLFCFAHGWSGLVALAEAFGSSKETLLADLMHYETLYATQPAETAL